MMHIDGACHCGAITFEADVDPETASICHCMDCQITASSAFRVAVRTTADHFRLLSGEPRQYRKTAASGNRRVLAFCGTCGTQLWGCEDRPDMGRISIRTGALAQRDELIPKRQMWCQSARSWLPGIDELPRVDDQYLPGDTL